jgi:hypothetical protein
VIEQIGIPAVVHEPAGHRDAAVDERHGAVPTVDQHRVGVAAETPLLFEEVHPVPAAQQSGARQAGTPAPMTAMYFMHGQE